MPTSARASSSSGSRTCPAPGRWPSCSTTSVSTRTRSPPRRAGWWSWARRSAAPPRPAPASRPRPLPAGEIPELEDIARDLARRADVPVPTLYLIGSDQPNAFATGRDPAHAAIAVTAGLLRHLPTEQVRGVLAHEFAHIKN